MLRLIFLVNVKISCFSCQITDILWRVCVSEVDSTSELLINVDYWL